MYSNCIVHVYFFIIIQIKKKNCFTNSRVWNGADQIKLNVYRLTVTQYSLWSWLKKNYRPGSNWNIKHVFIVYWCYYSVQFEIKILIYIYFLWSVPYTFDWYIIQTTVFNVNCLNFNLLANWISVLFWILDEANSEQCIGFTMMFIV